MDHLLCRLLKIKCLHKNHGTIVFALYKLVVGMHLSVEFQVDIIYYMEEYFPISRHILFGDVAINFIDVHELCVVSTSRESVSYHCFRLLSIVCLDLDLWNKRFQVSDLEMIVEWSEVKESHIECIKEFAFLLHMRENYMITKSH